MNVFQRPVSLRWADLDPNYHVRHSVYYDWGATLRLEFLSAYGLSYSAMQELHFGPILFREEAIFKREIRPGDQLMMNVLVTKLRRDYSRFSFRHELIRDDGTLCALLHVDGAWIDTQLRKLTIPPAVVAQMAESGPKAADFEWI